MSRPSSRTSRQRSGAWGSRGWATAVPWCQNVPERSRRRPIARSFSIISSVSPDVPAGAVSLITRRLCRETRGPQKRRAGSGQPRDPVLGEQLLLLQPDDLDLLPGGQGAPPFQYLELLVEATMFGGELFQDGLLRTLGRGCH